MYDNFSLNKTVYAYAIISLYNVLVILECESCSVIYIHFDEVLAPVNP